MISVYLFVKIYVAIGYWTVPPVVYFSVQYYYQLSYKTKVGPIEKSYGMYAKIKLTISLSIALSDTFSWPFSVTLSTHAWEGYSSRLVNKLII